MTYRHECRAPNVNEGMWTPCPIHHRRPEVRDRCDAAWRSSGCETRPYRDMEPLERAREVGLPTEPVVYRGRPVMTLTFCVAATDV